MSRLHCASQLQGGRLGLDHAVANGVYVLPCVGVAIAIDYVNKTQETHNSTDDPNTAWWGSNWNPPPPPPPHPTLHSSSNEPASPPLLIWAVI